jgi:FkbM family methyltransferase
LLRCHALTKTLSGASSFVCSAGQSSAKRTEQALKADEWSFPLRTQDIETENKAYLTATMQKTAHSYSYRGFVDVDFLKTSPFVMFTNSDCSVCSEVLSQGSFEFGSLSIWVQYSREATGIIDIGAYSGIFSLAAAAVRPDIRVHAFEPNPFTCARLRLNKVANGLFNIVDHNAAIGDEAGFAELRWKQKRGVSLPSNATFAAIRNVTDDLLERATVQVRTLEAADFAASLGNRLLMKIDVEGVELAVFKGLRNLLPLRPDIILETFDSNACALIQKMLEPYDYKTYLIHEHDGTLQPQDKLTPCDPMSVNRNQLITTLPRG